MKIKAMALMLLAALPAGAAESLSIKDLGALNLNYAQAKAVGGHSGKPLRAEVSIQEGQAFKLLGPIRIQQLHYLVPDGAMVQERQPVLKLSGSEVHHFTERYAAGKSMLAVAKQRYDSNLKLYRNKVISEATWQEINRNYLEAKLAFGHLQHFMELVVSVAKDNESMIVGAPSEGRFHYADLSMENSEEPLLATILPGETLRLGLKVPVASLSTLTQLRSDACVVDVAEKGGFVDDFFVQVWSKPLTEQCHFLPGQRVMVQPYFDQRGYLLPKQAVFRLHQRQWIMIRDGEQLQAVPVDIEASESDSYVVSCSTDLEGREILVTSVSAAQGMLLGMGGE